MRKAALLAAGLLSCWVAEAQQFDVRVVAMFNQHLYYGTFARPRAVAIDREHNEVWVSDTGNSLVGIYKPDGTELYAFAAGETLREPVRIAIGPKGLIAVIEGDHAHLRRFNYRGDFKGDIPLEGLPEKPILGAVAFDSAGNLYVGENRSGQVFIYTAAGKLKQQFGSKGSEEGQFRSICGIAIGDDGTIDVLDQQAIAVQLFDAQGNFIRGWGRHEVGAEHFSLPSGIALDGKGHILVTDELRHQVKIFDTEGKMLDQFGGIGGEEGKISFPTDVAVDSAGRIYVTERGNSRVQVFEIHENTHE